MGTAADFPAIQLWYSFTKFLALFCCPSDSPPRHENAFVPVCAIAQCVHVCIKRIGSIAFFFRLFLVELVVVALLSRMVQELSLKLIQFLWNSDFWHRNLSSQMLADFLCILQTETAAHYRRHHCRNHSRPYCAAGCRIHSEFPT